MAPQTKSYDYIVCGGGTAGCVVASRLAEANYSVLLLEAGGSRESVPASIMPAAQAMILGTEAEWNIYSEREKGLNNRKIHLARGKFLGGTSGANGTLCCRGTRGDYDSWGVEGWSGDEMHRYMSKAEGFRNKPWFKADESAHGHEGPLITAPHDPAPISELLLESFQSKGLPFESDMFTSGSRAHGCGHGVRSVYKGIRTTSADNIRGDRQLNNVQVELFTSVDRVLLERVNGELEAVGVAAVSVRGGQKTAVEFTAKKEVILSLGAYCTPTALLRSGIGPKNELKKHGIQQHLDLSGVGQNLQDHLILMTIYEVSKPDLTLDAQIYPEGMRDRAIAQWEKDQSGFMSQFPFGIFAYARLDERLADSPLWQKAKAERNDGLDPMDLNNSQPHVEFSNVECYPAKYGYNDPPKDGESAFVMTTELFSQKSRGQVTLASTDPTVNPIVEHNYLSHPLDILVFAEGCRLANEVVVGGKGTKDIIAGSWPKNLAHHAHMTRERWEKEIREKADTCKLR